MVTPRTRWGRVAQGIKEIPWEKQFEKVMLIHRRFVTEYDNQIQNTMIWAELWQFLTEDPEKTQKEVASNVVMSLIYASSLECQGSTQINSLETSLRELGTYAKLIGNWK